MKRWQALVLGLIVSAIALALALRQTDLSAILAAFQQAHYGWVALTGVLFVGLMMIRALRWSILTEGRLNVSEAFWLFSIGYLFNNILPARLGEVIRAVLAGQRPEMQFGTALSTIIVERLFDMIAVVFQLMLVLLLLDLPPWASQAGLLMGGIALTGVVVLAYAANRPDGALKLGMKLLAITPLFDEEKAHDFLQPFIEGLAGVSKPRVFAAGLGISIVAWLASGITGWTLLLAFFGSEPLIIGQLTVAAAGLGVAVPAAPSGVGPFHAAVIEAMDAVGYDRNIATSYAFALHAYNVIIPSALGLIGLLREGLTFSDAMQMGRNASSD